MIAIDDNSQYSHQLYFFTDESKEVRNYFSGLLCNTTTINDHQIKNLYNYDELAQKIAVLTQRSDCYKIINSMLKTEESLKIIVALLFKGFSWTNELLNSFNISRKLYIVNTMHSLQKLNLLVKEKGERLNPYYYEALETSKSMQIRKALHQADMYYITKDFVKFCSLLKGLFEYKIAGSESFRFSLKDIIADAKKFQIFYDRIMDEELNLMERQKRTDDGILYFTNTIKSRNMKKELKQALAELKVERLEAKEAQQLLTQGEKNQLAIVRSENNALVIIGEDPEDQMLAAFRKNKRPTMTYNGQEITGLDVLDELAQRDKEIEEAETINGKPEMAHEKSIYDNGIYLSAAAREEWEQEAKPKTAEQEVDDLFASMGVNM